MSNNSLFDAYADSYDGHRRDIIPQFETFYGTMLDRIPHDRDESIRVLDLGAGTGLSTELIRAQYQHANVVLVDESEEMLERARERFEDEDYDYRRSDVASMEMEPERYDVIFSALVLHYLSIPDKQKVLERGFDALNEGGVFVAGTIVDPETEAVREQHEQQWIREAREDGTPEEAIQEARERQGSHELASVNQHLDWFRDVGFECVDCWFKYYGLAVFSGRK